MYCWLLLQIYATFDCALESHMMSWNAAYVGRSLDFGTEPLWIWIAFNFVNVCMSHTHTHTHTLSSTHMN